MFSDIDWTTDATLPGPYDTYSLGVFRHPIVHLRNFPGYHHSNHNPYPHPHTILQQNTLGIAPDQLQSHGLLSMFSVLVSQAREQGIKLGEHLNQPLTTKCIVTNGIEYLFMCYQLNTLSMQEEHGIKNIAWTSNLQCVAKRKNNFPKNKVAFYECLPQALQESQFSEECFRNLVSFMCQETQWNCVLCFKRFFCRCICLGYSVYHKNSNEHLWHFLYFFLPVASH